MQQQLTPELRLDIKQACEVLQRGGIILYPTDTIWGIGCDATNADAVKKVFELKRRDDSKALITLVPEAAWIERYVEEVPDVAWELLDAAVDPLTVIYDKGRYLAPNLLAPDGSVAIRVTKELYSHSLLKSFRRPIVSTSANISGSPAPSTFNGIDSAITDNVDYIAGYRRDDSVPHKPSGIIKLGKGGLFKIIR